MTFEKTVTFLIYFNKKPKRLRIFVVVRLQRRKYSALFQIGAQRCKVAL